MKIGSTILRFASQKEIFFVAISLETNIC